MGNRFEKKILWFLLLFGMMAIPLSLRGKNYKNWLVIFLLNSYSNTFVAPVLAKKKYLQYPVRFLKRYYKSSIIYDYYLCSLVSVWYCRASKNDNWKRAFWKVWLFSTPQALVERWLEKYTNLIRFKKEWTWLHSLLTITIAKLSVRIVLYIMNWADNKKMDVQK